MYNFLTNTVKSIGLLALAGLLVMGARVAQAAFITPSFQDTTFYESGWNQAFCDKIAQTTTAATTLGLCGSFNLFQSTAGTASSTDGTGYVYDQLKEAQAAVNSGVMFTPVHQGLPWLYGASSTPVFESVARINTPQNSTSTVYYLGFTSTPSATTFSTTLPTAGCYLTASSTKANWILVATDSFGTTDVDTAVASSSNIMGTGNWRKFRVALSATSCIAYIQKLTNATTSTTLLQVGTITGLNVPTTTPLNAALYFTQGATGGFSNALDFMHTHFWWKDLLPSL